MYGADSIALSDKKGKGVIFYPVRCTIHCIDLPLLLRVYPEKTRQLCLFGGMQLGYVVDGKFWIRKTARTSGTNQQEEDIIETLTLTQVSKLVKTTRFQCAIVGGFSYEFRPGLTLGFSAGNALIDVIQAEKYNGWNLYWAVGYNFAKVLK
ncbi:hypothetical protein Aasi_0003 [Candidatus Amoebophilus asiaticus 5a2]|uniref:Outer membrane protein beta-barrel domain-containing protein n=1 Tax=Amoebophilus asiaticus (strain 5a2) TaxID=452471 RepID=B3EU42_AMOA5|nr:hypothetical protein Aasi_0003 [Candidatus Amoebophilus asiaticus 5a2]